MTSDAVSCTSRELALTVRLAERKVFYELPLGAPPATGWPAVFFFQGSFVAADRTFAGKKLAPRRGEARRSLARSLARSLF